MMKRALLIGLTLLCCAITDGQRIMWWNVENLFDCKDDPLRNDEEFLPEGNHHWTLGRYWHKMDNIARVVAAVADEKGWPALIGIGEVENDSCLFDLVRRSPLRTAGYEFIITNGPDVRGVDVGLLYQPKQFFLEGYEGLRVPSAEEGLRPTRDILHAWGRLPSGDLMHVFAVHFPSKAGSGREGNRNRSLAAQTLRAAVERFRGEKILVMGDFNAEPGDIIFSEIMGKDAPLVSLMPLSRRELRKNRGTYVFQKQWGFLDHVLVSKELMPCVKGKVQVARFNFLLDEEGAPWRTYRGPIYQGGYSDHLPIWVDLSAK